MWFVGALRSFGAIVFDVGAFWTRVRRLPGEDIF
jgi:hypothetical protein